MRSSARLPNVAPNTNEPTAIPMRSGHRPTASSGENVKDLLHVTVAGGRRLLQTAAVLTRVQVGRVPVPPVVLGVRLLVAVVLLRRLAEELCKGRDVRGPRSRL